MDLNKNPVVKEKVRELGLLIKEANHATYGESAPTVVRLTTAEVERAVRLLRPNTSSAKQTQDYAGAIRTRLRSAILSHHSAAQRFQAGSGHKNGADATHRKEGQLQLAKFERLCDDVRKHKPRLLHPLLLLLQPLAFQEQQLVSLHRYEELHRAAADAELSADSDGVAVADAGRDMAKAINSAAATLRKEVMMSNQLNWNSSSSATSTAATVAATAAPQVKDAEGVVWVEPATERKLLRDLLFVLQGIAGKHIKFDSRSENYVIDPSLQLNRTVQDAVLCICELGWLYGRVSAYLKSALSPTATTKGLVVQAFGFALQVTPTVRQFLIVLCKW